MARKKNYLNNKSLLEEIKKSKAQGSLTKEAIKMLILLSEKAVNKLKYKDPRDKEDCISFAQMDLFQYWDRFNPDISSNAFAYFTQIAKKGYAKGWNKLHPSKYSNTISIDGSNSNEHNGIYSI